VLFEEARIVVRRKNGQMKTAAMLNIQALSAQYSKEALDAFRESFDKLQS
jgi:hypothetical protein